MKKIGTLIDQSSDTKPSTRESTCGSKWQPPDVIVDLFAVLSTVYPDHFTRRYADASILEAAQYDWAMRLQHIPDRAIMAAANDIERYHPKWMPNVGEFKLVAKAKNPEPESRPPALTNPTKPETVRKSINEIKRALGEPDKTEEAMPKTGTLWKVLPDAILALGYDGLTRTGCRCGGKDDLLRCGNPVKAMDCRPGTIKRLEDGSGAYIVEAGGD